MKTEIGIILSIFVCTTLGISCPTKLLPECSCEHNIPSSVDVICSFASQVEITKTLIQDNSTDPNQPMKINLLNMTGSNLTSLPSNFLQGIGPINKVDLSRNLFTDIPACLQTVENITTIDISFNQIKSANLSGLQTQTLDISQNMISEFIFSDTSPKKMNFLKCSNNKIKDIPRDLWTVAESLDISFNLISQLPNAVISSIKSLYLRGNSLKQIPDNWFLGFKSLEILDVSKNQIKDLTNKTLSGLPALSELQLSQNQLSEIPNSVFQHTFLLKNLNLNENKIRELSPVAFKGLAENLDKLSISKNELELIADDTFADLKNLLYLDLSDNVKIKDIDNIKFPGHVSELNFRNCGLQQISDCKFFNAVDLQRLDLSKNNLTCNCHLSWLYATFESKWQTNKPMSMDMWMCKGANDQLKPVDGDLSACIEESIKEHHCRLASTETISPDKINLTVFLSKELMATWEIAPESVVQSDHVFKVVYLVEGEILLESPLLDNSKRLFFIEGVEKAGDYTICVQLLKSDNSTVKEQCEDVVKGYLQLIVGILAGVVFIIPCIAALTYILIKDSKMMKYYDPVNTDVERASANGNLAAKDKASNVQRPAECYRKSADMYNSAEAQRIPDKRTTHAGPSHTNPGYVSDRTVSGNTPKNVMTKL